MSKYIIRDVWFGQELHNWFCAFPLLWISLCCSDWFMLQRQRGCSVSVNNLENHDDPRFWIPCADPEGGPGFRTPPPLKNHNNIGFLSNSGPDPLKHYEATEPAFKVGPSSACKRNAILMALRWRANDDPLIVVHVFRSSHPSWTKIRKKNVVKVGLPLTKFSGSAHGLLVLCIML